MSKGDRVNLVVGEIPEDYHCDCRFCKVAIGNLRPEEGRPYSRLERREYYHESERGKEGHAAKTPLHIARWAIQAYTGPDDWVLDPTIGAGTTAVEAITQGRNVAGLEIQFGDILIANIRKNMPRPEEGGRVPQARVQLGDARYLHDFMREAKIPPIKLVINNPPYSGDEHWSTFKKKETPHQSATFTYQDGLPNLAFLKEGQEYWDTMSLIYQQAADHLVEGGHFVIGIKDMMRSKKPFLLHKLFCEMMEVIPGMSFQGTAFLAHYPRTLFLNTYHQMYGVHPPYYQTISVFRKGG